MLHLWIIYVLFVLFLLCFHARLFIDVLWSSDGKGLASWLWFMISNCEVVTFPFVSWVRCGTWLYRFQIFALFLTWSSSTDLQWQVLELRIVEMISSIKKKHVLGFIAFHRPLVTGTGAQLNSIVLYLQILRLIVVVLTFCDSNCNSVYKYWPIVTCPGALGSSTDL